MDEVMGFQRLAEAVVIQAVEDYQHDKYRRETRAFFSSDGFAELWQVLTDGRANMPHVKTARQRLFMGQAQISRKAYHRVCAAV
jgi:adenosylcobinamide amidohydrolase